VVLQTLKWDISVVTPYDFIDHMFVCFSSLDCRTVARLRRHCHTFIALCATGGLFSTLSLHFRLTSLCSVLFCMSVSSTCKHDASLQLKVRIWVVLRPYHSCHLKLFLDIINTVCCFHFLSHFVIQICGIQHLLNLFCQVCLEVNFVCWTACDVLSAWC